MKIIRYPSEYFNIKDTLECGQIFRFKPYRQGFLVFSIDKCCYAYQENDFVYIHCNGDDEDYFYRFFDLDRDYSFIYHGAVIEDIEILSTSANMGKGIRILNQDINETVFSFIISQNNNITRIKNTIEKLCARIGEQREFMGERYYRFPTVNALANQTLEFYYENGLGYRAEYLFNTAKTIVNGYSFVGLNELETADLKSELLKIKGIGDKVANCITLFGYHRSNSFPVDTWIEKVYYDDFKGELKDRKKITEYFVNRFGDNSGYYQQYLFNYKRNFSKK